MLHKYYSQVLTSKPCVLTTFLEFKKKHDIAFIEVYLGAWSRKKLSPKIISVKLLVIVYIVFKRYRSTYCLVQGCCFICSDFEHFTSTLELQPLSVYHVVLRLD